MHDGLGRALEKQGHLDDAIAQFNAAISISPKFAEAHNNLGLALLATGQPAQATEAAAEFKTAISLNPHFADAENNLGTLSRRTG